MNLDFIESPFGNLPVIEGKAVCSQKNPWSEAEQWVSSLDVKVNEKVFVIGGGAGFHLNVLSRKGIHFCALELNPIFKDYLDNEMGFVQRIYSEMPHDLLNWDRVVSFRPAWQTNFQAYEQIFAQIYRAHIDNYSVNETQQKKALEVLRSLIKA